MKNGLRGSLIVMVLALLLNASCITTPIGVTASTTPVHDKKTVMNYGPVRGTDRVWSVFGLWMIGRPDIDRAIQDALKQKGGDALINVTCYEKTSWFFFVSSHTVIVEGEAVSFDKAGREDEKASRTLREKKK